MFNTMETPMPATLLHIDFAFPGPWGSALAEACRDLAADIATEPGLRWKMWGEDPESGHASGEYLFDCREHAQRYLDKHLPRLAAFGATEVHARLFDINAPLSAATRAPVTA
ncbi:Putative monooxygenase YdhR [Burkholderiaceae bacterium]|nr:Putative monooxygenase YdhR [Burkholderiaceae bacterium]